MKLSQADLGRKVGISQVAIRKIEAGSTVRSKYLPRIVAVLGLNLSDFDTFLSDSEKGLSGAPVINNEGQVVGFHVPLVGYVGAGSEAHFYALTHENLDEVPAVEGATDKTVAVEIRGDSLGSLFNRWLVYYDDVRRPVTSDLLRALCVVGLADDRVLIKKLHPSPVPGVYDLISENEAPIRGVRVEWAAKVKAMTPH